MFYTCVVIVMSIMAFCLLVLFLFICGSLGAVEAV